MARHTPRHVARHAPPRRRLPLAGARRDVGLTWPRLASGLTGSARGLSVLMAAVTLVTTLFLVATPILQHTAYDRALGDALTGQPTAKRDINLRYPTDPNPGSMTGQPPGPGPAPPFEAVDAFVRTALGPKVLPLLGKATHASTTPSLLVAQRAERPLTKEFQQVVVRLQSDVEGKVRWVEGAAPGAPTDRFTVTQGLPEGITHVVPIIPVALRDTTATTMELGVGDVLELTGVESTVSPMVVKVVGIYTPADARDPLWESDARMLGIARVPAAQGAVVNEAAMLASPDNYGAVSDSLLRLPLERGDMWRSVVLTDTWRYPLVPERLRESDVPILRDALFRLQADARTWQGLPEPPSVSTGLVPLLAGYERSLATTGAVISFAYAGIAGLSALTLTVSALAGLRRRRMAIMLMRARGASIGQVLPLMAVATSALAVGAAALVGLVARLVGDPGVPAWIAVFLVVAVPLCVVLGGVILALRVPAAGVSAVGARARTLRRVVIELAIIGVAVLAATTVRSRAAEIAGAAAAAGSGAGRIDWYAALTPFLLALATAVVALRVLPLAIGFVARLVARRRSVVAFLGFTRAARSGAAGVVPVAALVVGSSLITLLGSVATDIAQHRVVASYLVVGADARVDAEVVDEAMVAAIESMPGVSEVAVAHVAPSASMVLANGDDTTVHVVAVDWPTYAKLLADTPLSLSTLTAQTLGAGGETTGGEAGGLTPVLVSRVLPEAKKLSVRGTPVPVHQVGVASALARVVAGRDVLVALVPRTGPVGLEAKVPLALPNTVFVKTSDPAALAGVERSSLGSLTNAVLTASGEASLISESALPKFVVRTQLAGIALGAALVLLAILLLLLASRQDRLQLLLRLRTMGVRRGVESRLAWAEVLPLVAVATAGGVVIGLVALRVIRPAIDLAPYTGGAPNPAVPGQWVVAALTWLMVVAMAASALMLETRLVRRLNVSEHLRRGDNS